MSDINTKTIKALNDMLAQEYSCAIRYLTHASVVKGPYAESVAARLNEIADDEIRHSMMLRERITALGGQPVMQVHEKDLVYAEDLDEILRINMEEEKEAISSYLKILDNTSTNNVILYRTIQDIIQDEQEHLEELENLQEVHRK